MSRITIEQAIQWECATERFYILKTLIFGSDKMAIRLVKRVVRKYKMYEELRDFVDESNAVMVAKKIIQSNQII